MFQLDPQISKLPDTISNEGMSRNWNIVRRNMKKFGIDLLRNTAESIM